MKKILLQIFVAAALFFGLWWALSRVDWIRIFRIEHTSTKTEEKLGELFWEAFIQSEKEVHNEKITGPVDSLLTQICIANNFERKEIKLHIIKSDEVNAFAFPNKHLVVFTSLLNDCKSEAELSGVMAHELAHIQKNHVMKKLVKEVGLSALISITTGNAGSELIKRMAKTLSSTAYDRTLESEADMKAVDYLVAAQIDAAPFADFLARLSNNEPDEMQHLTWISTHPDSKERAEKIIEALKDMKQTPEPVLAIETWELMKKEVAE